tara:strand:- start:3879 stop:4286 length:408 start_codon:yes stop_codon:yes gene_type:complete
MKKKICIVMSTYNLEITNEIRRRTLEELKKSGIKTIDNVEVPGAFELPVTISKIIKKYDGFIAIGCIIKGETLNFDLISTAITNGIMDISIKEKKPIGNALLTCFDMEQAKNRLNKGNEAAKAVVTVLKNDPKKT